VSAAVVKGIGGIVSPILPVGEVYHKRLVPAAVSGAAISWRQYVNKVVVKGAEGVESTVTVISVLGLSQEPSVWLT